MFPCSLCKGLEEWGDWKNKEKNHPNKNFVNFLEKNKPIPSDFLSLTILAATQLTENVSHMKPSSESSLSQDGNSQVSGLPFQSFHSKHKLKVEFLRGVLMQRFK